MIVFIIFLPAAAISSLPPETSNLCPQYIWINCAHQCRHKNGALTQYYYIRYSRDMDPGGLVPGDCTAIYRFRIRSRPKTRPYGFDLFSPREGYFTAPVVRDQDGLGFTITSQGNNIAEVYVTASCGPKQLLAHVVHPIFGKAPHEAQVQQGSAQLPWNLPQLRLTSKSRVTYMMTGLPYTFMYAPKGKMIGSVSIIEEQGQVARLSVSSADTFSYTAPHDPKLDNSGPYDCKQTVVLVEESFADQEYATTRTLLLHRAYLAHNRLKPGLILFCATVLVFSILTIFNRKHRWI